MVPRPWRLAFAAGLGALAACGPTMEPTLAPGAPPVVERGVTFCVVEGAELRQDILRPVSSRGDAPAIVYVPGGAWQEWVPRVAADAEDAADDRAGRPDLTYAPIVRHLAARGFVVLIVYPRGGPAHRFPAHVEDVKCAIRSLRANADRYGVDTARVGILGGSSGGHIAALVALSGPAAGWDRGQYAGHSSRVRAAVVAAAPAELAGPIPPEHAPLFESVFGTAEAGAPALVAASAGTYATADDPPFMLLHGSVDDRVPVAQSQALLARLLYAGVVARLIVVRGAGHDLLWPEESAGTTPTPADVRALVSSFLEVSLARPPDPR